MSDSRVKKSTMNMVMGFSYQFITLVLSFVSRTVFIHTLGDEYLGLNGIFGDVLNLLSMADLGFNTAMAYSFYKPLADGDEETLAGLICFYKKVYRVIAIAVTVVGLLVTPFLRLIIKTEQDIPLLEVYYLFSLANIVISYLFVYKTTILTADQKNYVVTRITIWTSLAKTVLQILALWLTRNYVLYLVIGVLCQLLNNVIATKKAEKAYPFIDKKVAISKETEKSIFANMKSVFLYKVSGTIFSATDNILISMLVSTAAVGIYSNYLMVSNKLLLILQIVFSAITASIGNVIVKEKSEKRYEIFRATQSLSFIFCGIITSVYCLTVNDLVTVWLGEARVLSVATVLAVSLNTYLACVLLPLWTYRDATGMYIKTKYIMLLGAILNIVLSIALGKIWGIAGIIFASALARLCTYFWYEPKLLFKEYFEKKVWTYYVSLLLNLALVALAVAGLQLLFGRFEVTGWSTLIVKGILAGLICCVVFFTAYCRTEGFKLLWQKAKSLFKR